MPILGGYEVSVKVDRVPLKEYSINGDSEPQLMEQDKFARCYIVSESGKRFTISIDGLDDRHGDCPEIFVNLAIDERRFGFEGTLDHVPRTDEVWIWTGPYIWTSSNKAVEDYDDSNFAFGDVVLQQSVDEKKERGRGTIIVTVWPGNYRVWPYKGPHNIDKFPIVLGPENQTNQSRTKKDLLQVNEKEKATRNHCVVLPPPECDDDSDEDKVTTDFHPNYSGQLQASGIIPSSEEIQKEHKQLQEEAESLKAELATIKGHEKWKIAEDMHRKNKRLHDEVEDLKAELEEVRAKKKQKTSPQAANKPA
ncbi:hypothetical protein CALVIDRAFT_57957 [Calocera viscosa TUFC12733]|uniref:DUF7918 domain-containing protein n=1 Tax=Calocera viscosa (strain TUFC12733) TaxID=1330018 RepID=A0A167NGW7_CALVF|nr:hypothetical protein CALVIDRAFT_57957 [Calocera viscosa TUFC12733]